MAPILQTIKRSWFKHFVTQISATMILVVTFTAALFIILAMVNIKGIFNIWGQVDEATVYISSSLDQSKIRQIQSSIEGRKFVESVEYISSDVAAEQFKERFSQMAPEGIETKSVAQFFPASYVVRLNEPVTSAGHVHRMERFSSSLKSQHPEVEGLQYGQSWMSKFILFMAGFESFTWFLVALIFLTSLFVSSNVIKTVLFAQRDEIEVCEFIGATRNWIYGPHILNCWVLNSVAFFVALLANYGIFVVTMDSLNTTVSPMVTENMSFFSLELALIIYGVFAVFVYLSSVAGIRNLNTQRKGELNRI